MGRHRRMHQGLVIAVFIQAGELKVPIQKQAQIRPASGHHNPLMTRLMALNHPGAIEAVLDAMSEGGDEKRRHTRDRQERNHRNAPAPQTRKHQR